MTGALQRFFLTVVTTGLLILLCYSPVTHGQDIRIPTGQHTDQAAEKAWAERLVGPEEIADNCASCHKLEAETWRHTRHALGFSDRHQSDRAKEVLKNLGQRSMKRGTATNTCRSCHFTSIVKRDRLMPTWGVSCESCHAPAKEWNVAHSKTGGDMNAKTLEWGAGKTEDATQRVARLKAAQAQGMIHSEMLYELAANCFACHAIPDETLVNTGDHKAGSEEFDLVAWSQGEIRHNFVSSPGVPDTPTNRLASQENRRLLFVVGALADLEFSLRNLVDIKQPGEKFHLAMIARVNTLHQKIITMLDTVAIPPIATALQKVPDTIDASTLIPFGLPDALRQANRQFVEQYDGTTLNALDSQIPTRVKGAVYKE